jgi:hypothetical protein
MTITLKTWSNQTVTNEDLAQALLNGSPEDFARTMDAFFRLFDHHTCGRSLDEFAKASINYGLPNRFEKFNRLVAYFERRSKDEG